MSLPAKILPTSKSTDGVKKGFDLPLIRKLKAETGAVIVASGVAVQHSLEDEE